MAKNQVIVSLTANTKDLQKGFDSAGAAMGGLVKVAAGVALAIGAATVAIGIKAVKAASNLEQAMGGLEAVFKDNSAQMTEWAQGAANSVGLAQSEYATLATVLGAQMKNMGIATENLGDQTNDLVGLGADLAAQFGGSTSDAVSALSSLLRGERNPIERYGVSMNEATVKAKMAEMGLTGLTGEAEKNAKLTATLAILYDQTADAQGAFARESSTLAGAQQRLSARFENLHATLGTALLPAVTAVVGAISILIGRISDSAAFEAFTDKLASMGDVFAAVLGNLVSGKLDFSTMFTGILDAAVQGITGAAAWLSAGGAHTLVSGLVSSRSAMFDAAFTVFPAILDALVQSIPAIVEGLVALVNQLGLLLLDQSPTILAGAVLLFESLVTALVTILPGIITTLLTMLPLLVENLLSMIPALLDVAISLFTSLVEALPLVLPPLIAAIVAILPKLIETILNMIPKILDAAIDLFTALVESLPVILPLLLNAIITLLPKIITTVIGMIPRLLTAAIDLFVALVTAVPKIIPELIPALLGLLPAIIGAIISLIPALIGAGVDLIGGLISGMAKMGKALGDALINIAKGAIKGFLGFLGIKSPSRLFMGFGGNLGEGLAIGIGKSGKAVSKALDGMSSLVTDGFDAKLGTPDMQFAVAGGAAAASRGNTYNIELHTLNATAETGRIIVESIRDYENAGGRL